MAPAPSTGLLVAHWSPLLPLELLGLLALEAAHLVGDDLLPRRHRPDEVDQCRRHHDERPREVVAQVDPVLDVDREPDRPADQRRSEEAEERVAPRVLAVLLGAAPDVRRRGGDQRHPARRRPSRQRRDQVGHDRRQLAQGPRAASTRRAALVVLRRGPAGRRRTPRPAPRGSPRGPRRRRAGARRQGRAGRASNDAQTSPSTKPILGTHSVRTLGRAVPGSRTGNDRRRGGWNKIENAF